MVLLSEPLITVAVQPFNQGRYFAEALESIFLSVPQVKNKQAADMNLFVPAIDGQLQFFCTLENKAKTQDNGGLS